MAQNKLRTRLRESSDVSHGVASYSFKSVESLPDSRWDTFLARHPSGHHVQTSYWSHVKGYSGWTTSRILIERDGDVVGGAQMFVRAMKFVGKVGYVPKGPVLPNDDRDLADAVMSQLREKAATNGVRVLFVQPDDLGAALEPRLIDWGFQSSPVATAPTATVVVPLSGDLDAILARMAKGMRNGIRRSQKSGVAVREGTLEDLPAFYRLLQATAVRRGFDPFSLDYFREMWRVLHPAGCLKLFICELGEEAVSAQIVVPFGNTVTAKQIGWSGHHGRLRPNEALDWATIQWAHANGFEYYDLEGIGRPAAEAIASGKTMPKEFAQTATSYKLKLGGEVRLFPTAYCYITNPLLRTAYNLIGYRMVSWRIFKRLINKFRTN